MNAIVSGALRAAVLVEGQTLSWLDEEHVRAVPCTPREARRIMLGTSDATYFEGIDETTTLEVVRLAALQYALLTRLSIALAADAAERDRRRSLKDLEAFLADLDIEDVRSLAYARPPADLKSALAVAREGKLQRTVEFLEDLATVEGAIVRVSEAWTIAAEGEPEAERARTWAVRSGFFRVLVDAIAKREHISTAELLLATRRGAALKDVSVGIDVVTPIIERWLTELGKGVRATVDEWQRRAIQRLEELRRKVPFARASIQIVDANERTLFGVFGFTEQPTSREYLRSLSEDRLMTRVIQARRPVFLPRTREDPDWTPKKETREVVSWIGAPLIYHDKVTVGLLTLDFLVGVESMMAFAEDIDRFCEAVADLLWLAGPLYRQRRAEQAIHAMKRIISIIATKHDPNELLQAVASEVALNLECSHCTIFLPEGRGAARKLVAKYPLSDSEPVWFPIKKGLVGKVYETGETLILSDAAKHPAFVLGHDSTALTRSMLLTPIKAGDQQIGVICADQDAIGWFRSSDATFLETLGQQAGLAMQRTHALDFLQSIAQTILALDTVDDILQTVLNKAIDLVNATSGVIYLVDSGKSPFVVTSTVPHGDGSKHPAPRVSGITTRVVESGEIVAITDLNQDDAAHPEIRRRFKSLIAVPLKIVEQVIGVLFVDDEDRHEFTEVEKRLLMILASQSAIAIQKTDELNRSKAFESQLVELNRARSVLQRVDLVLDRVGNGLVQVFGASVSPTINVYDAEAGRFTDCRSYGVLGKELSPAPRSDGFGAYVLGTKMAMYLEDINEGLPGGPSIRAEHRSLGLRSLACIPLFDYDTPVGVLFANFQKSMKFTPEERRKIELYAAQASAAVKYAMVCESVQNALSEGAEPGDAGGKRPSGRSNRSTR